MQPVPQEEQTVSLVAPQASIWYSPAPQSPQQTQVVSDDPPQVAVWK